MRLMRLFRSAQISAIALTMLAVSATAASGATVLGQVPASVTSNCLKTSYWMVNSSITANYTVAQPGVITSWSTRGNSMSGREMGLRVFQLQSGNTYRVSGSSGLQTLTASIANVFTTRVSVVAGDRLGIYSGNASEGSPVGGAPCIFGTANGADLVHYSGGFNPEPSQNTDTVLSGSVTSGLANLSATVEPDADLDGYGDETQDACATDSATQLACPVTPAPTPAEPADSAAPGLIMRAPKYSAVVRDGLLVRARASENATLNLSGELIAGGQKRALPLGSISKYLQSGTEAKLTLKLSKRRLRIIRRQARRGDKPLASLTLLATDAAGNASQVTARISFRL